ncbi:hypothetical protein J2X11_001935 [Aeromicrobium panaciterrae]|uniref:DUF3367 domain-containing protein n=1 Tax=Aeromicrobium panaciterrae TaxID=363861 RepID=A0ABU1UPI7_9ACTN|nr:hypothetical protein [Aeromicrobium panaciterrae]MDR7087096.1 hypothetical protein [Aeromicrobium panaciterrae]
MAGRRHDERANVSHRDHLRRSIVPLWAAVLALAVCAPLFARGYVLSYDMVWVPHLDLDRAELWGLGSALPRAVPSDAVVALLGSVIPAAVVQRIVLFAALFLIATGVGRLLRDRPLAAQLAGATFAVWNPFVAERLVLGQWPLLLAAAAIPWLIAALLDEEGPRWPIVVVALAGTALTPATGLMGLVIVLVAGRKRVLPVLGLAGLLNLPWVVAGVVHSGGQSDPAAVGLFEVQGEGHFGRLGSVLTLGGIWNSEVVPTSRTLGLTVAIAAAIGVVIIVGLVTVWRGDRQLLGVLAAAGAVGLVLALAGWLVPDLIERIVSDVPGGGLVRDGTRWLALLVPLEAVAFGAGVCALLHNARAWVTPIAVLGLVLPVAALPDLAWGVGGRLEPATYPAAWTNTRTAIAESDVSGDILVLPFSAYRRPSWNHDTPVFDPAGRFFGRTTVTNDELDVSGETIRGEGPRAAAIGKVLNGTKVLAELPEQGIGIIVVDTKAPRADEALALIAGAEELPIAGDELRLFALPGATPSETAPGDRWAMTVAWLLAGLTLLGGVGAALRRSDRETPEDNPRDVTQA